MLDERSRQRQICDRVAQFSCRLKCRSYPRKFQAYDAQHEKMIAREVKQEPRDVAGVRPDITRR